MARLLSFFSIDDIENFLALDEQELEKQWKGYREFYGIRYYIFCYNLRPPRIDGRLTWYYSGNPLEKVLDWIRDTIPGVKEASI